MKNKAITSRDEDFAKWYTDVVKAAKLADYSNVKGCVILEPNGYAIWEKMQSVLDARFKQLGHQNVYMPVLIPESLLKKEGELICSNHGSFKAWLEFMMEEEAEFGEKIILERGKYTVDSLTLYKTMEKRLKTVKEDENAIILFPYPMVLDMQSDGELNMLHFCGDMFSSIFEELRKNGIVGNRQIYTIYPSADNKMVLRCLNTNQREYIVSEEMSKVFAYSFSLL